MEAETSGRRGGERKAEEDGRLKAGRDGIGDRGEGRKGIRLRTYCAVTQQREIGVRRDEEV